MKVKVRKFGAYDKDDTIYEGVGTIQAGRGGTIVWVSEGTFTADLVITMNSTDHVRRDEDGTLWIVGEGND